MKQRPRRAENKIAEILNEIFINNGLAPIERIPILGRTGPDLTSNEAGLALDVKSRQSCPIKHFKQAKETGVGVCDQYLAISLDALQEVITRGRVGSVMKESKLVASWLDHMRAWVEEHMPTGIPGLVLHRPQMPYGKSLLIIGSSDIGLLRQRITSGTTIFLENGTVIKTRNEGEKVRGYAKIYMTPEDLMAFTQWTKRRLEND